MRRLLICLVTIVLGFPTPALAWNALGHKIIAEIAWQQLPSERRQAIVDVLKRHPRFAEDFRDLSDDHEIFLHAAVWPDIARNIRGPDRDKFGRPIWHYVNFPIVIDRPEPKLNLSSDPQDNKSIAWNVMQATNYCLGVINSDAPPQEKALAYSWVMHLVGDAHQPMHSTALFSSVYPKGDRGGNDVKLKRGGNLHSLWDGLLGRSGNPTNAAIKLQPWRADTSGDITSWIRESHDIARNFAYSAEILAGEEPTDDYFPEAGRIARERVVAAGLRLGHLLSEKE